jgi:hypothetical protein
MAILKRRKLKIRPNPPKKILTTSKTVFLENLTIFLENFPKGSLDHVAWDQGSVFFFQIP